MADFSNSPNMGLPIPNVGVAPGPDWATLLNSCLTIVDQHTHLPGSGVPITPDALAINSDLPMGGNNLTGVRSVRMNAQGAPLALAADLGCVYVSGLDLYYNDINGTQIRITQSGGVAGTPGSISNLVSPASATYVPGTSTFVWQSGATTPANMDLAALVLRNLTPSSNSMTVQPPAAMGSNSTITLPMLPATPSMVGIDASGNMSAVNAIIDVLMPAGSIIAFGGAAAPSGRWLLCDGTAVSRVTYAGLFSAIGISFGEGDASTTFNLPDFRGKFLRGVDNGAGNDPDAATRNAQATGGNTGDAVGSIQGWQNATHSHGVTDPGHSHLVSQASNGLFMSGITNFSPAGVGSQIAGAGNNMNAPQLTADTVTTGVSTQAAGGAQSNPINAYVNYIIKY